MQAAVRWLTYQSPSNMLLRIGEGIRIRIVLIMDKDTDTDTDKDTDQRVSCCLGNGETVNKTKNSLFFTLTVEPIERTRLYCKNRQILLPTQ